MIDRLQEMIDRLQDALLDMEQLPEPAQEELAAQIEVLLERLESQKKGQGEASSQAKKSTKKEWKNPVGAWADMPDPVDEMFEAFEKIRHANPPSPFDVDDELQRVVASIRACKPSQPLPVPDPAVRAAIVAHLSDKKPFTPEELDQYERELRAVEDELRAAELNDMYKDASQ